MFRSLQVRLTCSYILITTAVISVLIVALTALVWAVVSDLPRERLTTFIGGELLASEIGPFLAPPIDDEKTESINTWLNDVYVDETLFLTSPFPNINFDFTIDQVYTVIITDADGEVVAGRRGNDEEITSLRILPRGALSEWRQSQSGFETQTTIFHDFEDRLWILSPIHNQEEVISTVIVETTRRGEPVPLWAVLVSIPLPLFFPVICLASFVGILAGALSARGLSRRLRRLTDTADAWAKGDFSVVVKDRTQDEIGQLGRQLNEMAEEIQNLLQSKTTLATVEERNRIARDLHDSAKQQIFAATMQISTAKALFQTDPDAALEHLTEAESLAKQIQKELSGLIQELRPVQLADKGLVEAMQTAIDQWSNRHDIPTEFRVQGARTLPLPVEEPLFRITQEGLSNIAKHAQATEVEVHLEMSKSYVKLVLEDNGIGFDPKETTAGFGLHSIRERAEKLNGRTSIHTTVGKGTALTVEIPLKSSHSESTVKTYSAWFNRFLQGDKQNE